MVPNGVAAGLRVKQEWHDKLLKPGYLALAIGLHGVLAVLFRVASPVSKLHAVATLVIGVIIALRSRRTDHVAYVLGYAVGCEVLWRMTRGTLVYEHGKYALIIILAAALIGMRRRVGQPLAGVQFLLLLPSAVLTVAALPIEEARGALAFNLDGPLALCLFVTYFSSIRLSTLQLQKLLLITILPLGGIALLTVFNLSTAPEVQFTRNSNYLVVGGFGPNQVAAVLGLGVYLTFFLLTSGVVKPALRMLLSGLLLLLTAQSIMTFSRNGIYCAVGACFLAGAFLMTDSRMRTKLLIGAPVLALIFVFVIFPQLDDLTGGALGERFQKTSSSGRDEIALRELLVWKENIALGVGPGVGKYVRGDVWAAAAHTEFTRLVGEHGLLGLGAIALYLLIPWQAYQQAKTRMHKALIVSAVGWSFAFMTANAMRLGTPGFMFGLACVRLQSSPLAEIRRKKRPLARFQQPRYSEVTV